MEGLKHMRLLGKKVADRITGINGVVTSLCYDLFGCIQACVNPGIDKDGKQRDLYWYDVSRLSETDPIPVMTPPNFIEGPIAMGLHGPAEKPSARQ